MYIFFHKLTLALVNVWLLCHRYHEELGTNQEDVIPLREFQAVCAHAMTTAGKGRKRGQPSLENDKCPPPSSKVQEKICCCSICQPIALFSNDINYVPGQLQPSHISSVRNVMLISVSTKRETVSRNSMNKQL